MREPAVANKFYPGEEKELKDLIDSLYRSEKNKINISYAEKQLIGGVVPHAGYIYSGYEAIHFFEIIRQYKTKIDDFIIINPNHSATGEEIATDNHNFWKTPLGKVKIDTDFINRLNIPLSDKVNKNEHSCEVMLPFLQHLLNYPFSIVPITMSVQNFENAKKVANAIFNANNQMKKNILIIASSDFSHFVDPDAGINQDDIAISEILSLNSAGLYEKIITNNISMCGYGPIMALMEYAHLVAPAIKAEILKRGNSGKTFPSNEVVDYVSMIFYNNQLNQDI